MIPRRFLLLLVLGMGLLSVSFWIAGWPLVAAQDRGAAASNEPGRRGEPAAAEASSHEFLGVERCEDCHREPSRTRIERGVTDFVTLNESLVWLSDIHSRAYELIDPAKSVLSRQICSKLGIADVSQAQECLSCHSNWLAGQPRPPTYDRGVTCESCHGASKRWDEPHTREEWRTRPVAEKEHLGMVDVRNPIKRAEQCLSCHIGDAASGKVVTHAMYAAGHPPLPSVEIESFARQMPPHWRYPDEKPQFKGYHEFMRENHRYLLTDDTASEAKLAEHHHAAAAVVLGGVMALRQSLDLLRDTAADTKQPWPELAVFRCAACHQELSPVTQPSMDRTTGPPGRPMLHRWPTALVRLAILHVSPERAQYEAQLGELNRRLEKLDAAVQATPFGQPEQVRAAAAELSDWLTRELIVPVAARPFDRRALERGVGLLAHIGSTESHDYDSARQLAWALRTLYGQLERLQGPNPAIRQVLTELSDDLGLDLPTGSQTGAAATQADSISQRSITPLADHLAASLQTANAFALEQFQSKMSDLRALLAAGAASHQESSR